MRMSDWSSDGCSSDLHALAVLLGQTPQSFAGPATATTSLPHIAQIDVGAPADLLRRRPDIAADRKSVVEGKSVSVRLDLGGRRYINKQTNREYTTNSLTHTICIYTPTTYQNTY